jgi:hypothetical protein
MVETALILLTFILMLIGTIDFGQVIYFHQSLVERARAAARYGAINPTDTTGIRNICSLQLCDGPVASHGGSAELDDCHDRRAKPRRELT